MYTISYYNQYEVKTETFYDAMKSINAVFEANEKYNPVVLREKRWCPNNNKLVETNYICDNRTIRRQQEIFPIWSKNPIFGPDMEFKKLVLQNLESTVNIYKEMERISCPYNLEEAIFMDSVQIRVLGFQLSIDPDIENYRIRKCVALRKINEVFYTMGLEPVFTENYFFSIPIYQLSNANSFLIKYEREKEKFINLFAYGGIIYDSLKIEN